jgi:hypothetical protein
MYSLIQIPDHSFVSCLFLVLSFPIAGRSHVASSNSFIGKNKAWGWIAVIHIRHTFLRTPKWDEVELKNS